MRVQNDFGNIFGTQAEEDGNECLRAVLVSWGRRADQGEAAQVLNGPVVGPAVESLPRWAVPNLCPAATLPTNPHPPV
jgi:hypothetical protein